MEQRRERPRVDHQLRLLPVDRAVYVKVEPIANVHRDSAKSGQVEPWNCPGHTRIDLQDQNLALTIEHRFRREKNVRAEDPIDFVALRTPQATEVDQDHRLVDQVECAEAKVSRDSDGIECAVDAEPRRDGRLRADRGQSVVGATAESDGAYGCAGIDPEA